MSPQVTITHSDGSTETIANTVTWNHSREIGEMEKLEVVVDRESARSVTLDKKRDEIELAGVKTGRLVDIDKSGATWTLIAYSFEWDAKLEEPTAGGDKREGTDKELVEALIADVDGWTAGTVEELTGPMSFVFNHAFAHEALRRIEKNVPGECRFNDDGTVDYVENVGTDYAALEVTYAGLDASDGQTVDVSKSDTVEYELWATVGAAGTNPSGDDVTGGGSARKSVGEIDTSDLDEIVVYSAGKGETAADSEGSVGWADGGNAEPPIGSSGTGGGGGAATAITDPNGVPLVACPAGGGGGGVGSDASGGAGGAEGGVGGGGTGFTEQSGDGEVTSDVTTGGDGGDAGDSSSTAEDGADAGASYTDATLVTESSTSLVTTVDGSVTVTLEEPQLTVSTDAANVDGELTVEERGRAMDATHLRIIGAHEGEAQVSATLVPDTDTASYSNKVTYTTDRWEPGDPRAWGRWENKDVVDEDTITEEAQSLGAELDEELVEVSATIVGEDIELGDWIHVEKDEVDLDRDMRVHRVTTRGDGATVREECLLSTRTVARDSEKRRLEDIQRFNVAFQGSSVSVQGGGSRQPVDSTYAAEIPFDYPDIEYENSAELHVRGLNYRHYSTPEEHDHDVTTVIDDHDHDFTYGVPNHIHSVIQFEFGEETSTEDGHSHVYDKSAATGNPTDREQDGTTTESGGGEFISETTTTAAGVSPGIEETFHTPSSVDVVINGTTVATDIGSGTFETVVDISGELDVGGWNLIELESDALGHIQATVSIDGYKQIGTNS